jgi:hypothetical protein
MSNTLTKANCLSYIRFTFILIPAELFYQKNPPQSCVLYILPRSSSMFIQYQPTPILPNPNALANHASSKNFVTNKYYLFIVSIVHQSSSPSESSLHLDSSPSSPPPNPSSPQTLSSMLSVITVSCLWICFRTRSRSGSRDARCSCWFRWASMGRVARSMEVVS